MKSNSKAFHGVRPLLKRAKTSTKLFTRRGFTLIEVMLFLAVSALMFTGLVYTTSRNIASQRFSSSVQDFTSFLRQVYNQVEDVQIANRTKTSTPRKYCTLDSQLDDVRGVSTTETAASGRTECSVYGKLMVFGENGEKAIHVYDVFGNVVDARHTLTTKNPDGTKKDITSEREALKAVKLGVLALEGNTSYTLKLSEYSYTLEWDAWVERANGDPFVGAFLIVRSPLSGVIHTYFYDFGASTNLANAKNVAAISTAYHSGASYGNASLAFSASGSKGRAAILTYSGATSFDNYGNSADIDLCVDSLDRGGQRRRDIRLMKDAHNSSDIILVVQDSETENVCYDES